MNRSDLNKLFWGLGLFSIFIIFSSVKFQENDFFNMKSSENSGNSKCSAYSNNYLKESNLNFNSDYNSDANNYKIIESKYVDEDLNMGISKSGNAVYDTTGERKSDVSKSDERDTSGLTARFQKNAKDLSVTLMKRLNLSLEQASDVSDALVDYQKDLYDAREKNLSDNRNTSNKEDNKEMTGSRNKNLIDAYRDADKKTNDKIEKILNKEQTKKYLDVKNSWWREVKDKVYDKEMKRSHKKLEGKKNDSDKNIK